MSVNECGFPNEYSSGVTGNPILCTMILMILMHSNDGGSICPFFQTGTSTKEEGSVVLDPFCGSGTVGKVCKDFSRSFLGIELNEEYVGIAKRKIGGI